MGFFFFLVGFILFETVGELAVQIYYYSYILKQFIKDVTPECSGTLFDVV